MTNLNQKKIQQKNAKQNASKQMLFKELFLNIIHFFNLKVWRISLEFCMMKMNNDTCMENTFYL